MKSNILSQYRKHEGKRVFQGDLLTNAEFYIFDFNTKSLQLIEFPYLVVLSQDCDLEQDFLKHEDLSNSKDGLSEDKLRSIYDKIFPSILVSECFPAENFRLGEHIKNQGFLMINQGKESKTPWKRIIQNETPRYHYLQGASDFEIPNLVIDFKRYYTIPRDYFYSVHSDSCSISLNEIYREKLSQRFSFYLSRIGLP